jgi:predicted nuclease of restriction endonuclease-like (RecB) superfamily
MDYWAATMQDDAYFVADDGWHAETYHVIETKKGKDGKPGKEVGPATLCPRHWWWPGSYGSHLIRNLARQLGEEFGGGVSVASLKNFRQFYLTFPGFEKSSALRSQLTWTHWRLVMRVDDPTARDYYIRETAEQGWNTRQLERNIATHSYRRLLSAPARKSPTPSAAGQAVEFIKDPYVLEFLGLPEPPREGERGIEDAIASRLRDFLMELCKGFSFVGRQFRVSSETSHFYVDLVFYNYLLKCFVLIDLKTGKLAHGDIGQMDMYVRLFDDLT